MKKVCVFLLAILCSACVAKIPKIEREPQAPNKRPKYEKAVRLLESHDYMRTQPAPDFWALISYYVPQQKGTCAASAIAMVLNALNAHKSLTSDDTLVTTNSLISKMADRDWEKSMREEKCYDLDRLSTVVKRALKELGHEEAQVRVVHVDKLDTVSKKTILKDLTANEKSGRSMILANFHQGLFTGDPEGSGHVSPIGAYDSKQKRVLILDVDRDYYEPYWVTEEVFMAGLNTKDAQANKFRGYIFISE